MQSDCASSWFQFDNLKGAPVQSVLLTKGVSASQRVHIHFTVITCHGE